MGPGRVRQAAAADVGSIDDGLTTANLKELTMADANISADSPARPDLPPDLFPTPAPQGHGAA
jgi:hypothetical protein